MSLLGTMLSEEERQPQLIARFRERLATPRRAMLAAAIEGGIAEGELVPETDVEVVVNMLVGSFYGVYVARGRIPKDWPERVLAQCWPAPSSR